MAITTPKSRIQLNAKYFRTPVFGLKFRVQNDTSYYGVSSGVKCLHLMASFFRVLPVDKSVGRLVKMVDSQIFRGIIASNLQLLQIIQHYHTVYDTVGMGVATIKGQDEIAGSRKIREKTKGQSTPRSQGSDAALERIPKSFQSADTALMTPCDGQKLEEKRYEIRTSL